MRKLFIIIALIAFMGAVSVTRASGSTVSYISTSSVNDSVAASAVKASKPHRPKVGLVLSGGGAKGIAHVGVLKMLEEMHIPVDYVTGTSIGSIIGGLYALGYSADEMEELILNIDWNKIMKDEMSRHERRYEFIERDDRFLVDMPIMNGKNFEDETERNRKSREGRGSALSNIPLALVEGQNLNSLFTQLSVGYQDSISFDSLPVPFACVAVDLVSRQPVVMRSGSIVDAIRSSMAIPGYFAPVLKNGKMLVDGGMLNNLPVDVARQMGADIIIAVDLHKFDKSNEKNPDNVGDMVTSILKIMNGEKYQESVDDADVCITPNTGSYGILDFTPQTLSALSDSGYFAALEHESALLKIAYLEKNYSKSKTSQKAHAINLHQDSVRVGQISITGADKRETGFLMSRCKDFVGEYVTGALLDSMVRSFYNTRSFSKVSYSLVNVPGDSTYNLNLDFKPEKLHSVGLGVRFDSEEIVAALLNVSINRHKVYGWKAELDLKLSYNPVVTLSGGFSFSDTWQLNAAYRFRRSDIAVYTRDLLSTSYMYYGHFFDIYMQRKGMNSDLRFIHRMENVRLPLKDDGCFSGIFALGVSYGYDTRDRGYFATRGTLLRTSLWYNYLNKLHLTEGNSPFGSLNVDFSTVISLSPQVALIPGIDTRVKIITPGMFYITNMIGGYEYGRYSEDQMPFVGTGRTYQVDDLVAVGRLEARWNFYGKHYLSAVGNVLAQAPEFSRIGETKFNFGTALCYTYDSPLGPVGLNVHYSNLAGSVGVYFHAGYSF